MTFRFLPAFAESASHERQIPADRVVADTKERGERGHEAGGAATYSRLMPRVNDAPIMSETEQARVARNHVFGGIVSSNNAKPLREMFRPLPSMHGVFDRFREDAAR